MNATGALIFEDHRFRGVERVRRCQAVASTRLSLQVEGSIPDLNVFEVPPVQAPTARGTAVVPQSISQKSDGGDQIERILRLRLLAGKSMPAEAESRRWRRERRAAEAGSRNWPF